MIYKITGYFTDENFNEIFDKINKNFNIIYYNNMLYIALIQYQHYEQAKKEIKRIFNDYKDFEVEEITENNILNQEDFIANWCKDNFVSLEKQKFEIEQQTYLRKVWSAMDNMEKELKLKAKEQKIQCS